MTLLYGALIVLGVVTTLLTPFLANGCCVRKSKKEKRLLNKNADAAAASVHAGSSGQDNKADEAIKTDKTQEETEPTQENSPSAVSPVKSKERI